MTVIRAAGTGAYATIGRVVISPAAPHLVLAAAGLHDGLALAATASHHFRHESFDFAGLAAAAAASWFGIPGPGEPVLIAAGVLAAQRHLALLPVLIVAWAAATAGGIAGWVLGRQAGRALLTWRGPLRATCGLAASDSAPISPARPSSTSSTTSAPSRRASSPS